MKHGLWKVSWVNLRCGSLRLAWWTLERNWQDFVRRRGQEMLWTHRAAKWCQTATEIGSPFDGGLEFWGRLVGFRVETNLWFGRCPWNTSAFSKCLVLVHPSKGHFVSQLHECSHYIRLFSIQLKTEMSTVAFMCLSSIFMPNFHRPVFFLSPIFTPPFSAYPNHGEGHPSAQEPLLPRLILESHNFTDKLHDIVHENQWGRVDSWLWCWTVEILGVNELLLDQKIILWPNVMTFV